VVKAIWQVSTIHAGRRGLNKKTPSPVGASLLAKNPRTARGIWLYALSFTTIAGKPAPTGAWVDLKNGHKQKRPDQ